MYMKQLLFNFAYFMIQNTLSKHKYINIKFKTQIQL